jgi:hypothetical protein
VSDDDEHSISYLALPRGVPVVSSDGDAVRVKTYLGGTPQNAGFHLIVVCS